MAAADVDRSPAHRSCSSVETSEDNLEWLKEHALGFDSAGLPMGFQLMTSPFQEAKMLDLGELLSKDVE